MIIYLYVKTHNKTGMKYLGKTSQKNPHKYLGSGVYWRAHLKKHGNDVSTEILKECSSKDDLVFWGKHYSKLFDVVNSAGWANLKPEEGDGFASGELNPSVRPDIRKQRSQNWSGDKNPSRRPENKKFGDANPSKCAEVRAKISGENHYMKSEHYTIENHNSRDPECLAKKSGDNHWTHRTDYDPTQRHGYDSTVFTFVNSKTGERVNMTKQEFRTKYGLNSGSVSKLAAGKQQTCNGWKLG